MRRRWNFAVFVPATNTAVRFEIERNGWFAATSSSDQGIPAARIQALG
jgi:hypothetical protein